jgi:hypothetical protein
MSKVIEYVDSLLLEGASPRMAILTAMQKFSLGGLSTRQLWDYYNVTEIEKDLLN